VTSIFVNAAIVPDRRAGNEHLAQQLREGGPTTVAAVAARARVSRATAYRHFLNNDAVALHRQARPGVQAGDRVVHGPSGCPVTPKTCR
jgi:Bacterial regulatory proteins, tetR family